MEVTTVTNEHKFILNTEGKPYKRQRVGNGVNLILAKEGDQTISHSFSFDSDKFTLEAAKSYVDKMGLEVQRIEAARGVLGCIMYLLMINQLVYMYQKKLLWIHLII